MFYQLPNNVCFHYEAWGEGPSVVFISGYTCDINLWRETAEIVAKLRHRVLIFDNQGIGKTKDQGLLLSCEEMAKNTVELFADLGFKKPVIVGYAMGGQIAQAIAIHYAEAICGMVLLSSVAKWNEETKRKVNKLIQLKYQENKDNYYAYLYQIAFGSYYRQRVSLKEFQKMLQSMPSVQSEKDEYRQLAALSAFDSSSFLGNINVPTLILAPDDEELAPMIEMETLAKKIKQAQIQIIQNCGHAPLIEQPEQVQRAISKFLLNHCIVSSDN